MREPYTSAKSEFPVIQPVRIFYSYSHDDEPFRVELEKHLSSLRRNGEITDWHDREINAGSEWKQSIDKNLEAADIILLLVSADFLASDYCYEIEMKRAMERHREGKACVIPIIVRTCDWSSAPFATLQALPKDAKPLSSWSDPDEGYHNVVIGIQNAAAQLRKRNTDSPPARLRFQRRLRLIIGSGLLILIASVLVWFALHTKTRNQVLSKVDNSNLAQTSVSEPILVTGFVVNEAGEGVENADIVIENLSAIDATHTATSGKFIFYNVPGKPGDLIWLKVFKNGYRESREPYWLNGDQKTITLYKKR